MSTQLAPGPRVLTLSHHPCPPPPTAVAPFRSVRQPRARDVRYLQRDTPSRSRWQGACIYDEHLLRPHMARHGAELPALRSMTAPGVVAFGAAPPQRSAGSVHSWPRTPLAASPAVRTPAVWLCPTPLLGRAHRLRAEAPMPEGFVGHDICGVLSNGWNDVQSRGIGGRAAWCYWVLCTDPPGIGAVDADGCCIFAYTGGCTSSLRAVAAWVHLPLLYALLYLAPPLLLLCGMPACISHATDSGATSPGEERADVRLAGRTRRLGRAAFWRADVSIPAPGLE
ncbi:hypothetical protein FB451DRAFT_1412073 [Mycena latifolia]|nr:hypothetical protein FB451DRAFT_1412073 [Mycena latifolia]